MTAPDLSTSDPRPAIAVVAHAQAPYRHQVHLRIVREMPEVRLWCLYTRELGDQPWNFPDVAATNPVVFGQGEGMSAHSPYRNVVSDWAKGGRMIRFLREHNVRAVVAGGYADAARMRIIWWCVRRGIPCFITGDANIACDLASGLKLAIKKIVVGAIIRHTAGVLPWGRSGIQFFKKYGATDERIWHFPYEPDYKTIEELPDSAVEEARAKFGLPKSRRRIVFCGRLIELKRVDLLIDAFAAIADRRPDWDLVIIGDGKQGSELRARVSEGLRSRVIWCGFLNDTASIAAVNRCCHVMAMPGDFEQWGLALNEGAACGLALVTSNLVGSSFDLVEEGVNGRRHRPGDLAGLTECLLDATDRARNDAMRAATPGILADYRRRCDPIAGLRRALGAWNVI